MKIADQQAENHAAEHIEHRLEYAAALPVCRNHHTFALIRLFQQHLFPFLSAAFPAADLILDLLQITQADCVGMINIQRRPQCLFRLCVLLVMNIEQRHQLIGSDKFRIDSNHLLQL